MVLLLVIIEQDGRRSGFRNAHVMVEHDDKKWNRGIYSSKQNPFSRTAAGGVVVVEVEVGFGGLEIFTPSFTNAVSTLSAAMGGRGSVSSGCGTRKAVMLGTP